MHRAVERGLLQDRAVRRISAARKCGLPDGSAMIRRGASFDISFCTETFMPRRSTPSSSAFIPMVVLMQVPRAVATRSVGENVFPFTFVVRGRVGRDLRLGGAVGRIAMKIAGIINGDFDHGKRLPSSRALVEGSLD